MVLKGASCPQRTRTAGTGVPMIRRMGSQDQPDSIGRMGDLFAQSRSAIVLPDGSKTTASTIAGEGRALAEELAAEGLMPGDRVAVRLANGAQYLRLLVACAAARLVLVSVNTRYSDVEANDLVMRSGAVRLFGFSEALALPAQSSNQDLSVADDPFVVFTTSGTTSRPKMVRHTQRSISSHGFAAAAALGYKANDVAMIVMPFCGTFGMSSFTAALAANATIVVVDQFDVAAVAGLIANHRVSVVNGSDDMYHRLLEFGADISTIRIGGYARFNSSLDGIVGRAEEKGATLVGLYGMSEVQALFSHRDPTLPTLERELPGGELVSPEAELKIVDNELYVRGPSLFEGYLSEGGASIDSELTASAFEDGWFKTGDSAIAERNRVFTYYSRISDVLRLGGFLVSPADIESILIEVPGIDEAQVVAVDRRAGARPVAFVLSTSGFDVDVAMRHCQDRLARYKVPVRIETLEAFPTTPSANGNKIQRTRLRTMAEELLRGDGA